MSKSILVASLFFGASLLLTACGDSSSGGTSCSTGQVACGPDCLPEADGTLDWVQANVFSVNGCATAGSCHDGSNLSTLEDLDLRTSQASFDSLVDVESSQADGRTLVVPSDSDASYLVNKLLGSDIAPMTSLMPIGATEPLCDAKIDGVREWIDAGAER